MSIVSYQGIRKLILAYKNQCLLLVLMTAMLSFFATGQQALRQPESIRKMDSIRMVQQTYPNSMPLRGSQPAFMKKQINIKKQLLGVPRDNKPLGYLDCVDTSSRFFIKTDSATFYTGSPIKTADGNLLVSGEYFYFSNGFFVEKGFLMKTDEYGTVLWTKLYDSLNHKAYSYINYYNLIELKDGSILLAGSTNTNNPNIDADFIVTKTDNTGNVTWSKTYTSRIWGTGFGDHFAVQQMKEDLLTGDLYITGHNRTQGYNIIKLNTANGGVTWSKLYQPPLGGFNNNPFGLDIGVADIHSFACFQSNTGSYINAYLINKNTGDLINAKYYQLGNSYITPLTFLVPDPLVRLTNGNYILSGSLWGYRHFGNGDDSDPYYQSGVIQMSSNLDFINAYCFRNSVYLDSYSKTTVYPDGSGRCHMLEIPLTNFYGPTTRTIEFDNGNILRQRRAHHLNEGYPKDNGWVKLADGGEISVLTAYDSINNSNSILFTKLHQADTASECLGVNEDITFTEPYQIHYLPDAHLDSIGSNVFQLLPDRIITAENFIANLQTPACNQISFCDTFAMNSTTDTVCLFTPVNIKITKRRICGSEISFNFDSSVIQSFVRTNDSVYCVIFKAAWSGKIYGSLKGCKLFTDSVHFTVPAVPPILNLGADTMLCSGDTIVLHAGRGYENYHWQDGSTDSIFTVIKPGTYYLTASNTCGGSLTDTIIVFGQLAIPFDLGPSQAVCSRDSLIIKAPSGYTSYHWFPDYNISSTSGQSVIVRPLKDTLYNVTAEITLGCFVSDSILITVKPNPVIVLGSDRNICYGDSTLLNAGTGFAQYQWSNGSAAQQMYVSTKGNYSVIGITADGCKSYDTLSIVNVWSNPIVKLDHNSNLCIGSARTLKPGNYSTYIWQDGSVLPTFTINSTGNYYVTVTDNHQCQGSDTVRILTLLPPPAKFLPADTSICFYDETVVTSSQVFSSYLWNTGETGAAVTIKKAGTYWLQATDQYACTGKDSITVLPKECIKGLYVPAAFSPNQDGKNDVFRPLIFGNVLKFEWTIYNRYGQAVFTTHNPAEGWDGTVKGIPQNPAGFTWHCGYQLEGEKMKFKSGSVVLIK
jgi:gliding motility-associated-like protein